MIEFLCSKRFFVDESDISSHWVMHTKSTPQPKSRATLYTAVIGWHTKFESIAILEIRWILKFRAQFRVPPNWHRVDWTLPLLRWFIRVSHGLGKHIRLYDCSRYASRTVMNDTNWDSASCDVNIDGPWLTTTRSSRLLLSHHVANPTIDRVCDRLTTATPHCSKV